MLERLRAEEEAVEAASVVSDAAAALNRDAPGRPVLRNADTFGYNARSEVTSETYPGRIGSYSYDEIGNLTWYSANNLNQYTEFAYDLDGNMTTNYNTVMAYDAQSRLATVSALVYTNDEWRAELLFSNRYDHIGRRVKKITRESEITFFYDGWNLIEERVAHTSGTNATIRYYWGKDLSGTFQGAGGVGGLLYLTITTSNIEHQTSNSFTPNSSTQLFIPCYDSNANITRYIDENGATVAQYTYDAFGNLLDKSGPMCDIFRHRFSTKYYDAEIGLYYYGYRFYCPWLMRWINRDPIGEDGGVNLLVCCGNNLIGNIDSTGLSKYWDNYYSYVKGVDNSAQVWKLVGGRLYWMHLSNSLEYNNTCALRVSRALNKSGAQITGSAKTERNFDFTTTKDVVDDGGIVVKAGTKLIAEDPGFRYILKARDIEGELTKTFGTPFAEWFSRAQALKIRASIERCDREAFFADKGHTGMIRRGYDGDEYFPYKEMGKIWLIPK